jgi:LEA14-like dessication related protein
MIKRLLMKRIAASVLLTVTLATATACGGGVFRQPEVTLQNVRIGGLGLSGGTLLVDLEIINPNRFALNADQLTYELALSDPEEEGDTSWVDFAAGTFDQPFSVASGDTSIVQIPVEFTYSGVSSAAISLLRSGTFTYRASGTVDVRTPLGGYEVPYRKRGTVTLLGSG